MSASETLGGRRRRITGSWFALLTLMVLVAALLFYRVNGLSLTRSLDASARQSADRVVVLLGQGALPQPLPSGPAQIVQVLNTADQVLAGSATADALTPLLTVAEIERVAQGSVLTVPGSRAALSSRLRVVGERATMRSDTPGQAGTEVVVVVATPTGALESAQDTVRTVLSVLVPVALLVFALIAWRLSGAALRPVLAARRRQAEFVADAAHELRSPLASMRTQLEVAQHLGQGGDLPADLLPEVDRLSNLVEDLLTLARSGADGTTAEPVDLAALAADLVSRRPGSRVPVELAGRTGDGATPVLAQVVRPDLARVLANLLDNALRHAESRVRVTTALDHDSAVLVVEDDGAGIAEADRKRVFERFTRLDDARDRDSGGSGLGLAIVAELVDRNGGSVRLEDAAPGVRAVVRLPASTR